MNELSFLRDILTKIDYIATIFHALERDMQFSLLRLMELKIFQKEDVVFNKGSPSPLLKPIAS